MRLKGLNKSMKMGHLDLPSYTVVSTFTFIHNTRSAAWSRTNLARTGKD